ncbi:phytanoyl-CoA dioxygenase family protein [Parasphingorhabdus sp.]|uniref:phytanoyl-CoA dioxygenase family protein n=1 Tax=Parasphingorhabdus sp. TaxID=2709688 RepID=UPI003266E81E
MIKGGADPFLDAFESLLPPEHDERPGLRLRGDCDLQQLLCARSEFSQSIFPSEISDYQPVRAILFNKSPENNWSLGWHQDRTVAVNSRENVAGFGPWTVKNNIIHAEPPFSYFQNMITIRVHLDSVTQHNAPLRVALGSHLLGKVEQDQLDLVIQNSRIHDCLAARGDVWVYATPILHCSEKSSSSNCRRVLQVDYSDQILPAPLDWAGLV